jgi:hypothetical protein
MQKFLTKYAGVAFKPLHSKLLWCLLLTGATGAQASEFFGALGKPASATLAFSIRIPRVLQVLKNDHPEQLAFGQSTTAEQHLLMVSTLGNGFCAELNLMTDKITDWKLHIADSNGSRGVWLENTADSYRLCTRKPGRYALTLKHVFLRQKSAYANDHNIHRTMHWPVSLSLSSP